MKLPHLLAHFLYQNKTLALPGIGVFTLSPETVIPEIPENEQPPVLQGVQFESKTVLKADSSLIEFIHKYTGKMKPLAESDLDSYLRLGIQLINIGKPFYLEGIGSVFWTKDEKFGFEPGEFSTVKLSLPGDEITDHAEKRKKSFDKPESEYAPQPASAKKIFVAIGIIGGIALIAWGGWSLYKKKTAEASNESNIVMPQEDTTVLKKEDKANLPMQTDSGKAQKKDSAAIAKPEITDSPKYKFVILATANKNRAMRRYNQLLSISNKVKMQTKDSSLFKIYFTIPAVPKDTLHIKDSLSLYYGTKTTIEQ